MVYHVDIQCFVTEDFSGEDKDVDSIPTELARDLLGMRRWLENKWRQYEYKFSLEINERID